jgi:hypothetical protein
MNAYLLSLIEGPHSERSLHDLIPSCPQEAYSKYDVELFEIAQATD